MTKRLYIDFHVIQTVPPSCVNRDDTGRPKAAVYGGVNRARISSQSWKHAVREYFKDIFTDDKRGFRTKYASDLITDYLKQNGMNEEEAVKNSVKALDNAGIKISDKKRK